MRIRLSIATASMALLAATSVGGVAAQAPVDPPHPAHIHDGVCPAPGDVVAPLDDPVVGGDAMVGVGTAIPVELSSSTVEMALADIVSGQRSINVHESAEASDVYIACGDLGGTMLGTADLAVGLAEQNASGHQGAAWLHDNGDGTTRVDVVLWAAVTSEPGASVPPPTTPGASEAPGGSMPPATSPLPGESAVPGGLEVPEGSAMP
jgi:hypothetical protein